MVCDMVGKAVGKAARTVGRGGGAGVVRSSACSEGVTSDKPLDDPRRNAEGNFFVHLQR
jgi:hypothetical protein